MGKQGRRVGSLKKRGVAYVLPPSAADDVHPVDMSSLEFAHGNECGSTEADTSVQQLMDQRNYRGGIVCKYWFPAPTTCLACMEKPPYKTLALGDLVSANVSAERVTRDRVRRILARCELHSARRLHETMQRIEMSPDNVEMVNRMVKRVNQCYKHVADCHGRPRELVRAIDGALLALDHDKHIPTKAHIAIQCVDGEIRFALTCMIMTSAM